METNGVHMKGVFPWLLVHWARCAFIRDFLSPLAALVSSAQNIFPHCTLFHSGVTNAQQAGQGVVLGRLSLNVCLWACHIILTPCLDLFSSHLMSHISAFVHDV